MAGATQEGTRLREGFWGVPAKTRRRVALKEIVRSLGAASTVTHQPQATSNGLWR